MALMAAPDSIDGWFRVVAAVCVSFGANCNRIDAGPLRRYGVRWESVSVGNDGYAIKNCAFYAEMGTIKPRVYLKRGPFNDA